MICRYCGKPLVNSKCIYCGYRKDGIVDIETAEKTKNENGILGEPVVSSCPDIYRAESVKSFSPPEQEYGMKWYKFLIYFALFAGAIVNFVTGIMTLSGAIYAAGGVTADMVYEYFPGLETWTMIYGFALMGVAVFGIVTRFMLAKFKKSGPVCLYVLYIINALLGIAMLLLGSQILHENLVGTSDIASMGVSVVMLIINIVYFKKRESLFIN